MYDVFLLNISVSVTIFIFRLVRCSSRLHIGTRPLVQNRSYSQNIIIDYCGIANAHIIQNYWKYIPSTKKCNWYSQKCFKSYLTSAAYQHGIGYFQFLKRIKNYGLMMTLWFYSQIFLNCRDVIIFISVHVYCGLQKLFWRFKSPFYLLFLLNLIYFWIHPVLPI